MPEASTTQDQAIINNDLVTSIAMLTATNEGVRDALNDCVSSLQSLVHMLAKEYEQPDFIDSTRLLASNEFIIDRHGRRYMLIFTPVALVGIVATVQGVQATITIPAGWTALNEPDRAVFTPPAGMSQAVILKYTNWYTGSNA